MIGETGTHDCGGQGAGIEVAALSLGQGRVLSMVNEQPHIEHELSERCLSA
jgi:hypothetical protein